MIVEKPKPWQLLRPITTGANSAMNQSEFLAITCNLLKAREKSRVHGAIGFDFASHWLKNWHDFFKPITKQSNGNREITFDSHLKAAPTGKLHFKIELCGRLRLSIFQLFTRYEMGYHLSFHLIGTNGFHVRVANETLNAAASHFQNLQSVYLLHRIEIHVNFFSSHEWDFLFLVSVTSSIILNRYVRKTAQTKICTLSLQRTNDAIGQFNKPYLEKGLLV